MIYTRKCTYHEVEILFFFGKFDVLCCLVNCAFWFLKRFKVVYSQHFRNSRKSTHLNDFTLWFKFWLKYKLYNNRPKSSSFYNQKELVVDSLSVMKMFKLKFYLVMLCAYLSHFSILEKKSERDSSSLCVL